jgi:hypothetical protein
MHYVEYMPIQSQLTTKEPLFLFSGGGVGGREGRKEKVAIPLSLSTVKPQ